MSKSRLECLKQSKIVQYYNGKNILVTGATGFMGKVMVEKLLRDCPDVNRIYILVRQKRGESPQKRWEQYITDRIFDRVRNIDSSQLKKIYLIKGDIAIDGMDMDQSDEEKIINNVHLIFHCAAKAKFSLALREALNFNASGTLRILKLAERVNQLQIFHHISTAFAFCNDMVLEERYYPAMDDPYKIVNLLKLDDETLNEEGKRLMKGYPNTYALSKCVAEDLVYSYREKFSIIVSRPSIVISAWKEPYEGWVEGKKNGLVGLMTAIGRGVLRTLYIDPDLPIELMPVDITNNAILALTYKRSLMKTSDIYYCNLTNTDTINWTAKQYFDLTDHALKKYPLDLLVWYPKCPITKNRIYDRLVVAFVQFVPSMIGDLFLTVVGRKRLLIKYQQKFETGMKTFSHYNMRPYVYKNDNFRNISKEMDEVDKELFFCDFKKVDAEKLFVNYVQGVRKYILNLNDESLEFRRNFLNILWYVDKLVKTLLSLLGLLLIIAAYYFYFDRETFYYFFEGLMEMGRCSLKVGPLSRKYLVDKDWCKI